MEPKRIILDCDPGADDGIAILLAAQSPELDLLGITTVAGNAPVSMTAMNACRILQLCRSTITRVYQGEAQPLVRSSVLYPTYCGKDGLCESSLPPADQLLDPEPAVDFIIRTMGEEKDGITIISTGPLTNLATAIRRAPDLCKRLNDIVTVAGYYGVHDPHLPIKPRAEWNVAVDPEAAKIVLESGIPINALGLDVTLQLDSALVDQILSVSIDNEACRFLEHARQFNLLRKIKTSSLLVDGMAVAYAIDPTLAKMVAGKTCVNLQEKIDHTATLLIRAENGNRSETLYAACQFDFDRYAELLLERVFSHETGNLL